MVLADFGSGQALWSIFWFFLFFLWIMLVFQVFADIFRNREMGGVMKVLWILVVLVIPYFGVFIYLIVHGGSMAQRQAQAVSQQQAAAETYIRDVAGTGGPASELAKLSELKAQGVIDDAEFARMKAKITG